MKKLTLTESQAAQRIGLSPSKLSKMRRAGKVPSWRQIGRLVRYTPEDVDRFIASQQAGQIVKCDQLNERRLTEVRFG